ncbi:MAG TPA: DUF4337 domain-containing protein [bacterium]|nr:DUF4337 domain-containing protein [bacterium]
MPEEIEVPTEELHEHMEHGAEESRQRWILGVALSSAFLAAFAAVAALMAGYHANEAMMERIKASDQWSYYQAKGIKSAVLETKLDLLRSLKKSVLDKDEEKLKGYKEDQEKIGEEAKEDEKYSEEHLKHHETLAHSVTLFQVAIAVGAIAALTRRKPFWFVSLGFGAVGIVFFTLGFLG